MGLDSFALGAPVWFLTLVGGALADSADRRTVIAKFQSIQMMCPILLVLLLLFSMVSPWMVIMLSLVIGVTDALSMPSFQSIVPSIVEHKQIASGLALNSTQFNLSRILGPAIAGVLLVSIGAVGCFAVSAISYVPFILVALWILPRREISSTVNAVLNRKLILANVEKISHIPLLRGALLTVFSTSLFCAPLITFIPIIIKNSFHGNAGHFSIAVGLFGVGGLLGAIILLFVGVKHDRRYLSSGFASIYGIVLILVALNSWFWGLSILLIFGGVAMSVSNISANTILQSNTPSLFRGQAVSLYMLAMRGGLSIGSLLTGLSVSLIGAEKALLINGVLALIIQLIVGREWMRSALP
jgi:predicted MFS family arabinose efflux permease